MTSNNSPRMLLVQLWLAVLLFGLGHVVSRCHARAVNVSNTWTMPQEGLNVFYRFFRDRISWFEADAVCQFHHANLVTVDNSFQFDATQDLLRELDVNDIVWIGLMRPQSSDRFMWSNSRPLVADTGYWAESLPLMDAPLCAVIDPIRDYRWHALRCGGPETASFLCEMPVPSWADACILKDMPNLTMQYIADTASIELIRNCPEEGLLKQTCRGKQDRDRAMQDLICPRERLEAQRINDITNSHFKSLQIINSIPSDNNENNDIELLPVVPGYPISVSTNEEFVEPASTEKNTVQRLIEQFNVDELMQADAPVEDASAYHMPYEIPKPVKKIPKKVNVDTNTQPKKMQKFDRVEPETGRRAPSFPPEDIMMGDQPHGEPQQPEHLDDEVSNEIMAPLPHRKKILPQDLKPMQTITEGPADQQSQPLFENSSDKTAPSMDTTKIPVSSSTNSATTATYTTVESTMGSTTVSSTSAPTTQAASTIMSITDKTIHSEAPNASLFPTDVGTSETSTTPHLSTATIGHPMHPQQPRGNVFTEESQHPHVKESVDNSHFIPPMLLVKSHYVPPGRHDHNSPDHHEHHLDSEQVHTSAAPTTTSTTTPPTTTTASAATTTIITTTTASTTTTSEPTTIQPNTTPTNTPLAHDPTSTFGVGTETHGKLLDDSAPQTNQLQPTLKDTKESHRQDKNITAIFDPVQTISTVAASSPTTTTVSTTQANTEAGTRTTTAETPTQRIRASEHSSSTTTTTPPDEVVASTIFPTSTSSRAPGHHPQILMQSPTTPEDIAAVDRSTIRSEAATTYTTTTTPTSTTTTTTTYTDTTTPSSMSSVVKEIDTAAMTTSSETSKASPATATSKPDPLTTIAEHVAAASVSPTRNFLNEDTEPPYKPNRRRNLTKPETVSYFKKILG